MSFDFSTLVTDRTQADVNRVKQIAEKIKNGTASESELAEFNSAAIKGAYNYTDLNRVTAAMETLKAKLEGYGYAVPGYQRIKVPHPVTGGGSRLPEGYIELSCIESTGTQYIDTGFKPKYSTRVVMDVSGVDTTSQYIFGARDTASSTAAQQFGVYRNGATTIRSDYFGTNNFASVSDTAVRTIIDKNFNVVNLYNSTIINTAVSSGECNSTLYLLALNNVGSATLYCSAKLYSCQIYDNGVLVRDYVPCKNGGGVVGLYDLVNDAFYQNAGTGAFTAGEEIAPPTDVASEESDPYLWYEFDWPTTGAMTVYLLNVSAIRAVLDVMKSTPSVPADMVGLLVKEANDIEQILLDVYRQINIMATTFIPCGEALCGGDNL